MYLAPVDMVQGPDNQGNSLLRLCVRDQLMQTYLFMQLHSYFLCPFAITSFKPL